MKIGYTGGLNGEKVVSDGTAKKLGWNQVAGRETPSFNKNGQTQLCYMYIREQNKTLFKIQSIPQWVIFRLNPQAMEYKRGLKNSVQYGMNGFVVHEGGYKELSITLEGNFGYVSKDSPLALSAQFTKSTGLQLGAVAAQLGRQDGWQAWRALYSLLDIYITENQRRILAGEKILELMWCDPLHSLTEVGDKGFGVLQWVVTPKDMPSLTHRVENQALLPYKLELIGVRDDQANNTVIRTPNLVPRLGVPFQVRPIQATSISAPKPTTPPATSDDGNTREPLPKTEAPTRNPNVEGYHFFYETIVLCYTIHRMWTVGFEIFERKSEIMDIVNDFSTNLELYAGRMCWLAVNRVGADNLYSVNDRAGLPKWTTVTLRGLPLNKPLIPTAAFMTNLANLKAFTTNIIQPPSLPSNADRSAVITYKRAQYGIDALIEKFANGFVTGKGIWKDPSIPSVRIGSTGRLK